MIRVLLAFAFVLACVGTAFADRIAAPPPFQRALASPVVVVGKVVSIEAETVDAEPYPGSVAKVAHHVALVKISDALVGAKGLTHVKIGFIGRNNPRLGELALKEGQEACFYLKKHSKADFFTYDYSTQPMAAGLDGFKDQVAKAKAALGAVTDPMKALKAEKPEDRYLAAVGLLTRYRVRSGEAEAVAVPAAETKLIFAAILEADWSKPPVDVTPPAQLVQVLSAHPDGFRPAAFTGQGDYGAFVKGEFTKWATGDGAKFELKKFVPKTAK